MSTSSAEMAKPFPDRIVVRRVANGWIIGENRSADSFVHVVTTPEALADHMLLWARHQDSVR